MTFLKQLWCGVTTNHTGILHESGLIFLCDLCGKKVDL